MDKDAPCGVGWIPPLAERGPERHATGNRSVQSPPQGPQNRYQDPATFAVAPRTAHRPAGWQSCLGRLPKPPENDKIAFRWGWHKLEMPQPLRRPAQTRPAPPERASSIGAHQCWLGTTPPEGRSERYTPAPRSVQRLPGLAQIRYQDSAYLAMGLSAYLAMGLRPAGGHRRSNTAVGDSIAALKMRFSPFSPPGTNWRRPSHS